MQGSSTVSEVASMSGDIIARQLDALRRWEAVASGEELGFIAGERAKLLAEQRKRPCDECGELPADCCCVPCVRDPIDPSDV